MAAHLPIAERRPTDGGTLKLPKKDRSIWPVGGTPAAIAGSKLPSNQQVLQRFFHLHNVESQTLTASATTTMREVVQYSSS